MILGVSALCDVFYVTHVLAVLASFVVLITLRLSARTLLTDPKNPALQERFPDSRNWAGRMVHLVPLTGLAVALSGGHDDRLSQPWIGVGILCYLVAAGLLEARVFPIEKQIAHGLALGESTDVQRATKLLSRVDTVLAVLAVALVVMIVQF